MQGEHVGRWAQTRQSPKFLAFLIVDDDDLRDPARLRGLLDAQARRRRSGAARETTRNSAPGTGRFSRAIVESWMDAPSRADAATALQRFREQYDPPRCDGD
ncbi:MAG TPA: hypothetical protein VNT03_11630 [Baekduia sp.]|nr:hypothetical protein [Baekduia sp.]